MRWSADTRAELRGQRRAAGVGELLGVDLEPEAEGAARFEHAPRLLDREGALVAEHVDELGLAGERRQDLVADQLDVLVVAAGVLLGGRVRRRAACSTRFGPDAPTLAAASMLALVLEREPVARLDLERRRAVAQERVEAAAGEARPARRPAPPGSRAPCS